MIRVVDQCQALILTRCQQLIRAFDATSSNVRTVLRLFYRMVVFDPEFDTALVEFLKQATGNFIQAHPDAELDSGLTIRDAIASTSKMSVSRYLNEVVFKNEEDPDATIFAVVPLTMQVKLQLLEYPRQSADNASPYRAGAPELRLPDPLDLRMETVSLLRSSKTVYDVLYSLQDIRNDPVLLEYDVKIDVVPTSEGEKIVEPLCCNRGYYLPGYYNTMVKRQGKVTRKCVVCGQDLDDVSYRKVLGERKGWSYGAMVAGALTLATYTVSLFFVIDHVLFY